MFYSSVIAYFSAAEPVSYTALCWLFASLFPSGSLRVAFSRLYASICTIKDQLFKLSIFLKLL